MFRTRTTDSYSATIPVIYASYSGNKLLSTIAFAEYNELKAQTADFDPDELAMAQLEIRPQKEASAESKIQAAYGDKYDFWTMISAKRDVAELLGEEEPRSIQERLRRIEIEKQRISREREPQRKKSKDHGWER